LATREKLACNQARGNERRDQPRQKAKSHQQQRLFHDHSAHVLRIRATAMRMPVFTRPARNGIRNDPVQTDRDQQRRQQTEEA